MAEQRATRLPNPKAGSAEAIDRISKEVDQWIEEIDIKQLGKKVQDFGQQNPVALAFAALTVGVAAGVLMKRGSHG